MQFITFVKYIE